MNTTIMTAKEYLEQAWEIDNEINVKLPQLDALRDLSTRVTSSLSDMPRTNANPHTMENAVVRIVMMEQEINADIDRLIEKKQEITDFLKTIPNAEYRRLLVLRYTVFAQWKKIADIMKYNVRHIYKLHDKALELVDAMLPADKRKGKCLEDLL